MRTFWTLASALVLASFLEARTVTLEQMVCNPGATFTLPVQLDNPQGIASVVLSINYNPDVLVLKSVSQGTLAELFTVDFTVIESSDSVTLLLTAPGEITTPEGGSLALLTFYVREGTAEMYSDLTLAKVEFHEETMTVDLSVEQPITPVSGAVRSFEKTATQTDRRSEAAVTVATGTQLKALTLQKSDTLQLADDKVTPIVITDSLTHAGELQLQAPVYGWASGSYAILQVPAETAPLTFRAANLPETCSYTSETVDGVTTYSIRVEIADELAVFLSEPSEGEGGLTEYDKVMLRSHLKGQLDASYTAVKVSGDLKTIQLGIDLGICPRIETSALLSDEKVATVVYEEPKLSVIGFDPAGGVVKIRVVPPSGATIVNPVVTGILHVYGSESLAESMTEFDNVQIELGDYLKTDTIGEITFGISLGSKSFVKVKAGRE